MEFNKNFKKTSCNRKAIDQQQGAFVSCPFLEMLTLVLSFILFLFAVGVFVLTLLIYPKLNDYLKSDLLTFATLLTIQITFCVILQITLVKLDGIITEYFLTRKFLWETIIIYWQSFLQNKSYRIAQKKKQIHRTIIGKYKVFRLRIWGESLTKQKIPSNPRDSSGYLLNYATVKDEEKFKA